jgi:hypothetical protein
VYNAESVPQNIIVGYGNRREKTINLWRVKNMNDALSLSDKICSALEQKGFEYDPPENTNVIYKGLANGVSLYFEKENDSGGPWMGLWVDASVSAHLRGNLKVEFHNATFGGKCGETKELPDEGGFWIYCPITAVNNSIVDWIISTLEEVGRRILFAIDH